MATVGDVAREAGVSRSTVSAVITGRKVVLPETRKKVEAAIAKLNYSVNEGARALATSRTMTLGLVVRFHEAEFSPSLSTYLVALSDSARELGYSVMLLTDADNVAAVRRVIAGRRVDGLIIMNVLKDDDPRLEPIHSSGFPAVLMGIPGDNMGIDAVDLDFAVAARMLVDQLVAKGHREALFIKWPTEVYRAGITFAAIFEQSALARAATQGLKLKHLPVSVDPEAARAELRSALQEPDCPHALLIHNDTAVAMLPYVLSQLNLNVPRDHSVVSLHSSELSRLYVLSFTSVESDPESVARGAVKRLVERIANPLASASRGLISPILMQRDSVKEV